MKISGHISDKTARIILDTDARALSNGSFSFTLRGLPIAWDRAHVLKMLEAWARRHRFTCINILPSKASPSSWSGIVNFWAPRFTGRTPRQFACPDCKVPANTSCQGRVKGVICAGRVRFTDLLNAA